MEEAQVGQEVEAGKDARTWGMLCHLSALSLFVVPFGQILGPLVVWLLKKETSPYVDEQGKEALNFQISMTIYMVVAAFSILVLIGILLLPAVIITDLVLTIVGAIKASNGEPYRYPLTIRILK